MRRVALCVATVALTALPARAVDRILYATANSKDKADENRVDGFRLGKDGGLAPTPTSQPLGGRLPRRLVVGCSADASTVLYVAEVDRVEVYEITEQGKLKFRGRTSPIPEMIQRDIALAGDGRTLYVPQPRRDRILAYPIAENGAPETSVCDTSCSNNGATCSKDADCLSCATGEGCSIPNLTCIQGPRGSGYDSVIARGTLLYVSAPGTNAVEVYALEADGRIGGTVTNADDTTPLKGKECLDSEQNEPRPETVPLSKRTRLLGARSMLLNENVLYVEEFAAKRIASFALTTDGVFNPLTPPDEEKDKGQQPRGRTAQGTGYFGLLIVPTVEMPTVETSSPPAPTLFGTQFFGGRIDAYALPLPIKGERRRPPNSRGGTKDDLKTSPVRMAADDNVLYVAAGALDRVQAYRLRRRKADGTLKSMELFSKTDEQAGSFPNDVAVAVLSGKCR